MSWLRQPIKVKLLITVAGFYMKYVDGDRIKFNSAGFAMEKTGHLLVRSFSCYRVQVFTLDGSNCR